MNKFTKDLLKTYLIANTNLVKIQYVRDEFGYKCGVVVKVGKGSEAIIGWSSVSSSNDIEYKTVKPHQTPIWQWMVSKGIPMDIIITHSFFTKLMDKALFIGVPKFDREIGLSIALNNALHAFSNSLTLSGSLQEDLRTVNVTLSNLIHRKELVDTIREVVAGAY